MTVNDIERDKIEPLWRVNTLSVSKNLDCVSIFSFTVHLDAACLWKKHERLGTREETNSFGNECGPTHFLVSSQTWEEISCEKGWEDT